MSSLHSKNPIVRIMKFWVCNERNGDRHLYPIVGWQVYLWIEFPGYIFKMTLSSNCHENRWKKKWKFRFYLQYLRIKQKVLKLVLITMFSVGDKFCFHFTELFANLILVWNWKQNLTMQIVFVSIHIYLLSLNKNKKLFMKKKLKMNNSQHFPIICQQIKFQFENSANK